MEEKALEAFPSSLESEVASALLLLFSTTTPSLTLSPPPEKNNMKKKKRFPVSKPKWSGGSSSSASTVTSDHNEHQQELKMMTSVAEFHQMMMLKVVRKRRSKSYCISDCRKTSSAAMPVAVKVEASSVSATTSSCLSSASSSAISSLKSHHEGVIRRLHSSVLMGRAKGSSKQKKPAVLGSGHMRRRADAIIKILTSNGCASEVRIRQLLGDSPSTSKALRILLNLEQVKRSGAGGRIDPYIYMIA